MISNILRIYPNSLVFQKSVSMSGTVSVIRYHFNEDARETMQEKINRTLVTEANRMAVY